jgi:hypothetical protein
VTFISNVNVNVVDLQFDSSPKIESSVSFSVVQIPELWLKKPCRSLT